MEWGVGNKIFCHKNKYESLQHLKYYNIVSEKFLYESGLNILAHLFKTSCTWFKLQFNEMSYLLQRLSMLFNSELSLSTPGTWDVYQGYTL